MAPCHTAFTAIFILPVFVKVTVTTRCFLSSKNWRRTFNTAHLRLNTFGDTGAQTNYILHVEYYLCDVPAHIWHSAGALRAI